MAEKIVSENNKEMTMDEIRQMFLDLADMHFDQFKEETISNIDKEIEDIKGTMDNEHLCELGFDDPDSINYHSLNLIWMEDYLNRLKCFRKLIDNADK